MRILLGSSLIIVGFAILWYVKDNLIHAYNTFLFSDKTYDYLLISRLWVVGQALAYLILALVIVALGIVLIRNSRKQFKRLTLSVLLAATLWLILEMPVYKCNYYNIRHSFWESKQFHFH